MDIMHTEDVSICMANTAIEKEKEYTTEFYSYLKSIETKEERPYNKEEVSKLAKEAKKSWDEYLKKECLIESAIYEKGSAGFNDNYNSCLKSNYCKRFEYYKKISSNNISWCGRYLGGSDRVSSER